MDGFAVGLRAVTPISCTWATPLTFAAVNPLHDSEFAAVHFQSASPNVRLAQSGVGWSCIACCHRYAFVLACVRCVYVYIVADVYLR